jgi:hypothetical protein
MRKTRPAASSGRGAPSDVVSEAPAPAVYDAQVRARSEGEVGDNPQNLPGELHRYEVDWVARQTALVQSGNRLIYSNRFQVAAFDLNSGQWQWRYGLGGEQSQSHDWNLTPMRPVVTPDQIFVRRLAKQGPALSCIEAASGKPLWSSPIAADRILISDPMLVQDQLFAITAARVDQELILTLNAYDPTSGALMSEIPLITLRDHWLQHRMCQAAALDDSFVVTVAGTILCCDFEGRIRWLRRQTWVPPHVDFAWVAQQQQPPLARDGRLYVMQPGVRTLVCLDQTSGRIVWQRVLPDAQRMEFCGPRLLVRVRDGLIALNLASGDVLWRAGIERMLDGQIIADKGPLLLAAREQVRGENNWRPVLVWLDPEKGKEIGRYAIDSLKHEKPKLGPLLMHDGKLWALFGRGDQEPHREFLQFTARPDVPLTKPFAATQWQPWSRMVDPSLSSAVATVLPGWSILDGRPDAAAGVQTDWQGEKQVLSTLSFGARPMTLVQTVSVPADGSPRLLLKVAGDPQGKWTLRVDALGEKLLEQSINQETTGAWKELSVDLAKFKGQTIPLVVRQTDEGGPQPIAKWKRLEVVQ